MRSGTNKEDTAVNIDDLKLAKEALSGRKSLPVISYLIAIHIAGKKQREKSDPTFTAGDMLATVNENLEASSEDKILNQLINEKLSEEARKNESRSLRDSLRDNLNKFIDNEQKKIQTAAAKRSQSTYANIIGEEGHPNKYQFVSRLINIPPSQSPSKQKKDDNQNTVDPSKIIHLSKKGIILLVISVSLLFGLLMASLIDINSQLTTLSNKVTTLNDHTSLIDVIRSRENPRLKCGIGGDLPHFSQYIDSNGDNVKEYIGLDVDYCRALAAAIFDPNTADETLRNKLKKHPIINGKFKSIDDLIAFVFVDMDSRFDEVSSGEVDVLFRNTTWTSSRDVTERIRFGPPIYYDELVILKPKDKPIESLDEICVNENTPAYFAIVYYLKEKKVDNVNERVKQKTGNNRMKIAHEKNNCAIAGDRSLITSVKKNLNHVIEIIPFSKLQPFSPVIKDRDDTWYKIVSYTVYSTIFASQLGYNKACMMGIRANDVTHINRFGEIAFNIKLPKDYFKRILVTVGNYHDIYGKAFGIESKIIPKGNECGKIQYACVEKMGINQPWIQNCEGLLISPTFTYQDNEIL